VCRSRRCRRSRRRFRGFLLRCTAVLSVRWARVLPVRCRAGLLPCRVRVVRRSRVGRCRAVRFRVRVGPCRGDIRLDRVVTRRPSLGIPRANPATQRASPVTRRDPLVRKDRREDTVPIHRRSDIPPVHAAKRDDDDFASALSDRALCARGRKPWLTPGQQLVRVRNAPMSVGFRPRISLPRSWRS
ncbi:MAG: hypothetical protein QOF10_967, partial [Kribbellaceae bacterium]|nr:hypothetical protein [Kribbellaceae bacterium]